MRVSRNQAAANRERVLDAAGQLFRERGFEGIGIADIMRAADLTHGGFYGQFRSKEHLAEEACARGFDASVEKWAGLAARYPAAPLRAIVASYLSANHRDAPGRGCLLPTLAVDAARSGAPHKDWFTAGLGRLTEILSRCMPGPSEAARRERALATLAGLVGALVLARAVADDAMSEEILAASLNVFGADQAA